MKEMTEVFTNYDVYKNSKMTKLNHHQVRQSTGCAPDPANQEEHSRLHNLLHMATMTQDDADLIFKESNCLLCQHPKSHCLNHHMTSCLFLSKYGITCGYNHSHDQRLSKFAHETDCRAKNKGFDAEYFRKASAIDKTVKEKK